MATPDAELKVRIEAELGGFVKSMREAKVETEATGKAIEKEVSGIQRAFSLVNNTRFSFGANYKAATDIVEKSSTSAARSFSLLDKASFTFGANFKRSTEQASSAGASLSGGFAKGANQAALATTNLSRVLQDAPFGFIGIQNNLNPLLESFGRLRAETGSNAGALKALVGSLAGPAGLGLALAAVSAGLLLYQEYQRKANKETVVAVDANKELADSIKSIGQVQEEGRKNASGELSTLQSLYGATQNLNIPQKERLKIAKEIIEKYPTYLQGMTAEGILAGEAATQYDKLTNAILAKGYVQAAEENRQKLINQQLNATIDRTREQIKLTKLNNEAKKRENQLNSTLDVQGRNALSPGLNRVKDEAEKARDAIRGYNEVIKTGQGEIKLLDNVVQGLIKDFGSEVLFDPEKPRALGKEGKTVADIFKALDIDLKKVQASVDGTFGDKSKERVSAFAKAIDELISIGIKPTDGIIKGLQERLLGAQLPNVANDAAKFAGVVVSNVQKGFENAGGVLPKNLTDGTAAQTLISPFQQLNDYIGTQVFPQLQSGFDNFFTDILEKGSFSFAKLGSAILKTFTSVLASEATKGVLSLLNPAQTSLQKGGGGLFGILGGLLGGGGGAAASGGTVAAGTAASGGLLLPILGGLAAGGLIASLFKKKSEPTPAFTTTSTVSSVASNDFNGGSVVFQISGTNLIGVLNRAGAKLARFNGTP